jgi:hypothetical protein
MTEVQEPDPDHLQPHPTPNRSGPDAAGRLLAAMLAAAGLIQPAAEPVLAEAAG